MSAIKASPLKIGIIGAGFSGTALAANIFRLSQVPVEVILFEKRGTFAVGDAYSSPFAFHLLNVRAKDMSAFDDKPNHFVEWLNVQPTIRDYLDPTLPLGDQFVPRFLYGQYLQSLLDEIKSDPAAKIKLRLEPAEVIDVMPDADQTILVLRDQRQIKVDKVILALGNNTPATFPFPVSGEVNCISNPWDFSAPTQIKKQEPALIVGTGLSMIDAVLTLYHQQHEGKIYAISRHGLLPLPHADVKVPYIILPEHLPPALRALTSQLRAKSASHIKEGGDWRSVINAMRAYTPNIWTSASLPDKKQFIRHVMPYWNIHRHRVHNKIAAFLQELATQNRLEILAGRVQSVDQGRAKIKLRGTNRLIHLEVKWLINCMGPSMNTAAIREPLLHSLLNQGLATMDPLGLGFAINGSFALKEKSGRASSVFYTVGSLTKGTYWETSAVPEIRKQCFEVAKKMCGHCEERSDEAIQISRSD